MLKLDESKLSNGTIEMIAQDLGCPIVNDWEYYEEYMDKVVEWIKKETT